MKKRYTTPTSEKIELADKLCAPVVGSKGLGGDEALGKGGMHNWDEAVEESQSARKINLWEDE